MGDTDHGPGQTVYLIGQKGFFLLKLRRKDGTTIQNPEEPFDPRPYTFSMRHCYVMDWEYDLEQSSMEEEWYLWNIQEFENQTSRFFLLDLTATGFLKTISFIILTMMYVATLSGNFLLIIAVSTNSKLWTPMYFFLFNLSVIDICFSTTVVPKILINTLSKDKSISLTECAIQMHFHLILGSAECFILAVMAYDRYAAICRPLHYRTLMSIGTCICLFAVSWSASFVNSLVHVIYTFQLSFCTHHVNHFFCEIPPFIQMSCSDDTWLHEVATYISAGIIGTLSFFSTVISYIQIVSTILKISASQGRHKAFSTCASHLIVVTLYYCTVMVMYLRPRSAHSLDIDKSVSLLYTTVIPMLNPIIYSIRNKDVKFALKENISKSLFSFVKLPVI
ncbi:olfactory receptor 5AR1-like [Gastrophryne carolinensis]